MVVSYLLQVALGTLLVVPMGDRPVRFGARLDAAAVAQGLSLSGRGVLQWRALELPERDGRVWVELAIVAPPGMVRVRAGGAGSVGPCVDRRGAAYVYEVREQRVDLGSERCETWRWCDGTVDERRRSCVGGRTEVEGEVLLAGEAITVGSSSLLERASPWLQSCARGGGEFWAREMGLLPARGGGGAAARAARQRLVDAVAHLVELPGLRGAGDFARSDGVITNLEFDTAFGLLRCGIADHDPRAFAMACRAARHLVDHDLDGTSGLPFVHGPDHRAAPPEVGHAWLRGMLWVGLVTADDDLVEMARRLGRAIAARPPAGGAAEERLRDYACPLFELEAMLEVAPDAGVERAADRLAATLLARFDREIGTFRFGEGELGERLYFDRTWLVGGLLLPALEAHLRRRPHAHGERSLRLAREALLRRVGSGATGLPTHLRLVAGRGGKGNCVVAEHRERGTVRAACLLDGFAVDDLQQLLRRASVQRAIATIPDLDDPDLATSFSLLARCEWLWR